MIVFILKNFSLHTKFDLVFDLEIFSALNFDNIMPENKKGKKWNKSEIITDSLWVFFGVTAGINYYSKEEYIICGVVSLLGLLYAYKLIKSLTRKSPSPE